MTDETLTIQKQAIQVSTEARNILVKDQLSYEKAGDFLKSVISPLRKLIKDTFTPIKRKIDEAKKETLAQERAADEPLEKAEVFLKSQIQSYLSDQERQRREIQRKLEEDARKKAEEEKLNQALKAEEQDAPQEFVDAILAEPLKVESVTVAPTYEKAQGVSSRDNWSAEVTDLKALVVAVANGSQVIDLILPNISLLNSMARSQKSNLLVPGVKAVNKPSITVR